MELAKRIKSCTKWQRDPHRQSQRSNVQRVRSPCHNLAKKYQQMWEVSLRKLTPFMKTETFTLSTVRVQMK